MKRLCFNSILSLFLVWTDGSASAQAPIIASFGRTGKLVCTNLQPGSTAMVEWASSPLGPWTNTWTGLNAVTVDSNGMIRVSVPMFYRVRPVPPFPVPSNMVWIPAGTFTMGCPTSEPAREPYEGPQTVVTISRGFCIGKYEVTQGEYSTVMGNNPSHFPGDVSRPVEWVTWDNAVAYCAALTTRDRAAGRLPVGYAYRLPTEAEWEYACRAGTTTPFSFGSELRSGNGYVNFNGHYEYPPCETSSYYCYNSGGTFLGRTTSVGSYAPNAWGLYDMHGNVREWCHDWWSRSLPGGSVTDPQGPPSDEQRVLRSGGYYDHACWCRSAFRGRFPPYEMDTDLGFRVALAPVP